MLAAASAGAFKVLIVMDMTRLSRSHGELPMLCDDLLYQGLRILTVQDRADSDRREEFLISTSIYGMLGAQYRRMIAFKVRAALKEKAETRARAAGRRVFGYRLVWDGTKHRTAAPSQPALRSMSARPRLCGKSSGS